MDGVEKVRNKRERTAPGCYAPVTEPEATACAVGCCRVRDVVATDCALAAAKVCVRSKYTTYINGMRDAHLQRAHQSLARPTGCGMSTATASKSASLNLPPRSLPFNVT